MSFNPGARKFICLKSGRGIVACLADVARAQPPGLTGNERARRLAPGPNNSGEQFHLRVKGREVRQADDRVSGIQAHAGNVHARDCLVHGGAL